MRTLEEIIQEEEVQASWSDNSNGSDDGDGAAKELLPPVETAYARFSETHFVVVLDRLFACLFDLVACYPRAQRVFVSQHTHGSTCFGPLYSDTSTE